MLSIVILNDTPASTSRLASEVAGEWLGRCASALQKQLLEHVAQFWSNAVGATVRLGTGPTDLAITDSPCNIIPSANDGGQEEAWHSDELDGEPDSFIALDVCRNLDDVSGGLSHEFCETVGNPFCSEWVTVPSGIALPSGLVAGRLIAHEISDPVQERFYAIDLGDGKPSISVSDFVLPAYFDLSLTGPTTYGELAYGLPRIDPFGRADGGYQLARNADGSGEAQVFGKVTPHAQAKMRRARTRLRRILHNVRSAR